MRAVLQRVTSAAVEAEAPPYRAAIGAGLLVLLGIERGDTAAELAWGAKKCAELRIFRDAAGKMNHSLQDIGGAALVVSQFTLCGETQSGRRPGFTRAAPPEVAEPWYRFFCAQLEEAHGVPVQRGVFQASMRVSLVNDGPVTFILDRPPVPPAGGI